MAPYSKNLVTGRQLRAARVLAGLTQKKTLGTALGKDGPGAGDRAWTSCGFHRIETRRISQLLFG